MKRHSATFLLCEKIDNNVRNNLAMKREKLTSRFQINFDDLATQTVRSLQG